MSRQPFSLAEFTRVLPPDLAAQLRAAHDEIGFTCAAHDAGQTCCLDYLLSPAGLAQAIPASASGTVRPKEDEG